MAKCYWTNHQPVFIKGTGYACAVCGTQFYPEDFVVTCGASIGEDDGQLKTFIGGCGKAVPIFGSADERAYQCADCSAPFHRECLREHFKHPMQNNAG